MEEEFLTPEEKRGPTVLITFLIGSVFSPKAAHSADKVWYFAP
jgi:hypothetical protein